MDFSAYKVTKPAPDFTATAVMPDNTFNDKFSLSDYKGKHVILFFYPLDFSSLCPTETIGFNARINEFQERDCQIIGCSCDSTYSHKAWCKATKGMESLGYPLLSDMTKRLSMDYGVLLPERGISLRGTFLIDPEGNLRWMAVYDLPIGRSLNEILRVIDALNTGEACALDWQPGS